MCLCAECVSERGEVKDYLVLGSVDRFFKGEDNGCMCACEYI